MSLANDYKTSEFAKANMGYIAYIKERWNYYQHLVEIGIAPPLTFGEWKALRNS